MLDESCTEDRDCISAYTYCKDSKCTCIERWSRDDNNRCMPTGSFYGKHVNYHLLLIYSTAGPSFNCPYGDPLKTGGNIQTCEKVFDPVATVETSNCPDSHFCFTPPQTRTKSGKDAGHCCPVPPAGSTMKPVCPLESPLLSGICPDEYGVLAEINSPVAKIRTCPYATHECVSISFNKTNVCCASPCRAGKSLFNVDGKCYEYQLIGTVCELDAQCVGGAACLPDNKGDTVILHRMKILSLQQ